MSDPQFSKASKEDLEHLIHTTQAGSPLFNSASYELQKRQSEKMTHEMKRAADASKNSDNLWWKKPVGITIITVVGALIVFFITALLAHFFPQLFHS